MRLAVGFALVGALACGAPVADARRAVQCQSARCSSVELVFLETGASQPNSWAESLARASAVPRMQQAGRTLVSAFEESGQEYVDKMAEYNKRVTMTYSETEAAVDRRDQALDGVKSAKQLIDHLREQIVDAELRLKRLRDPAPLVPTNGDFRLYFSDPDLLAEDDKKVLATVLKKQYPDAVNLTCLCHLNEEIKGSTVGPVLGAFECDCQDNFVPDAEEQAAAAAAEAAEAALEEGSEGGDAAGSGPQFVQRRPSARTSIMVGKDRIDLARANVIHIKTVNHNDEDGTLPPEVDIRVEGKGLRTLPIDAITNAAANAESDVDMAAAVQQAVSAAGLQEEAPEAAGADAAGEATADAVALTTEGAEAGSEGAVQGLADAVAEAAREEPDEHLEQMTHVATEMAASAAGEGGKALAFAVSGEHKEDAQRMVQQAIQDVLDRNADSTALWGKDAASVAARLAVERLSKSHKGRLILDPRAMVEAVLRAQQATLNSASREKLRLAHEERVASAHLALDDAMTVAHDASLQATTGPAGAAVEAVHAALNAARAVAGATGLDELIAAQQAAETQRVIHEVLKQEPVISATGLDLVQHEHEVRLQAAQAAVEAARKNLAAVYSLRARVDASDRVKKAAVTAAEQAVNEAVAAEQKPEEEEEEEEEQEGEGPQAEEAMQFIATESKLVDNRHAAAPAAQRSGLRRAAVSTSSAM